MFKKNYIIIYYIMIEELLIDFNTLNLNYFSIINKDNKLFIFARDTDRQATLKYIYENNKLVDDIFYIDGVDNNTFTGELINHNLVISYVNNIFVGVGGREKTWKDIEHYKDNYGKGNYILYSLNKTPPILEEIDHPVPFKNNPILLGLNVPVGYHYEDFSNNSIPWTGDILSFCEVLLRKGADFSKARYVQLLEGKTYVYLEGTESGTTTSVFTWILPSEMRLNDLLKGDEDEEIPEHYPEIAREILGIKKENDLASCCRYFCKPKLIIDRSMSAPQTHQCYNELTSNIIYNNDKYLIYVRHNIEPGSRYIQIFQSVNLETWSFFSLMNIFDKNKNKLYNYGIYSMNIMYYKGHYIGVLRFSHFYKGETDDHIWNIQLAVSKNGTDFIIDDYLIKDRGYFPCYGGQLDNDNNIVFYVNNYDPKTNGVYKISIDNEYQNMLFDLVA